MLGMRGVADVICKGKIVVQLLPVQTVDLNASQNISVILYVEHYFLKINREVTSIVQNRKWKESVGFHNSTNELEVNVSIDNH